MLYVGIDLHRKSSQLAVVNDAGELVRSRRVRSRPEEVWRVFGELPGEESVEAVFEATFGYGWLADLLADAGIRAHMAHPLATKAIAAGRVKNDKVDAAMLAQLLRANLLPEGWIARPWKRGRPGAWCGREPRWSGCDRGSRARSMRYWQTLLSDQRPESVRPRSRRCSARKACAGSANRSYHRRLGSGSISTCG